MDSTAVITRLTRVPNPLRVRMLWLNGLKASTASQLEARVGF